VGRKILPQSKLLSEWTRLKTKTIPIASKKAFPGKAKKLMAADESRKDRHPRIAKKEDGPPPVVKSFCGIPEVSRNENETPKPLPQ